MSTQQDISNAGKKTVSAYMRIKSFSSVKNPTESQLEDFDEEVNDFLETIDNVKRFLNGRNSYVLADRTYVLIWYLETIPQEPVITPFGQTKKEEKTNESDNSSEKK